MLSSLILFFLALLISFHLGYLCGRQQLKHWINKEGYDIVVRLHNRLGLGRYSIYKTQIGKKCGEVIYE